MTFFYHASTNQTWIVKILIIWVCLNWKALENISKRPDIVIRKAHKNNKFVVMRKADFLTEGTRQLKSKYYQKMTNPYLKRLKNVT